MKELRQRFEEALMKALIDLANRARKISDLIGNSIDQDVIDDSIDEFYIEFDSFERPIFYPILGEAGLEQWHDIVKSAPIIGYTIPSETRNDDLCYYLDYGDGVKHWCYLDESISEIEKTCPRFNEIMYCHRFTFHANIQCIKFTDGSIA